MKEQDFKKCNCGGELEPLNNASSFLVGNNHPNYINSPEEKYVCKNCKRVFDESELDEKNLN